MTDLKKTSERVVGYCPLGGVCDDRTDLYRRYARYLEELLASNSIIRFSNGGDEVDWCYGGTKCNELRCWRANVNVCRKEGLDPDVYLDRDTGRPVENWKELYRQQNQNNGR